MKAKQILFNGESVRGILDGRKMQTRRVIKPQPIKIIPGFDPGDWIVGDGEVEGEIDVIGAITCPYGYPGRLLWVRETAKGQCYGGRKGQLPDWIELTYRADESRGRFERSNFGPYHLTDRWTPSIFMPRWASRIALRVKRVWVERVQDISIADISAEGIHAPGYPDVAREMFAELWNSINAKRGLDWDVNPWVWCVDFEVTE